MISKEVRTLIDAKVGRVERQAKALLANRDDLSHKLRVLEHKIEIMRRAVAK